MNVLEKLISKTSLYYKHSFAILLFVTNTIADNNANNEPIIINIVVPNPPVDGNCVPVLFATVSLVIDGIGFLFLSSMGQ